MNNLTFSSPNLSSFCQLNKLGLVATGQHITESHAVLECRFTQLPEPCPKRCFWYLAWHTANNAIINKGQRLLFNNQARFDGVTVLGVDEHVWRHTGYGDKYVTAIIDLTPVRNKTGPARLLDVLEGRSKQAFKQWLQNRPQPWRDKIESIAMDGFSGFESAAEEVIPKAKTVLDPFHVVRWASSMLDDCRRCAQREILGNRRRKSDLFYKNCRVLLTRTSYLYEANKAQLDRLFLDERYLEVDCSWSMYQQAVTAYNEPDRRRGKKLMQKLMKIITAPDLLIELIEIKRLGMTLKKHVQSILAYFDRPATSNGPTEAINGRLEHLRGIALGFRNLANYIARCLLESGRFKKQLHP